MRTAEFKATILGQKYGSYSIDIGNNNTKDAITCTIRMNKRSNI
jgi:hypothetical protein